MPATGPSMPLDQRGLKSLVLWLVWAIASGLIFGALYNKAGVWSYISHDHTRITWLIIGMFLLGVLVSFLHTCVLTLEWFRAYRLERQIRASGVAGVAFKRRRVVDRFLRTVQDVMDKGNALQIQPLVELEFSGHHRASQFVNLMGNLLITMGIIGTVFGLTITLSGLAGSLSAVGEDQDALLSGLRQAMSGMGVAFYTTLLGSVLGGVLLRVFAYISETSVESLEDLMARICHVHAHAEGQVEASGEVQRLEREVARLQSRLDHLQESFIRGSEAMQSFRRELQSLQQAVADANEDEALHKALHEHRRFARILWEEMRIRRRMNGFLGRLKYLLGLER